MKRRAIIAAALAIRATFAWLAAATIIVDAHPIRRVVVALCVAIATGAAVRVQEALR